LRFDDDRMPSAVRAAKARYRSDFLKAIDECLKLKSSERPQSVGQLRLKLLGKDFHSQGSISATKILSRPPKPPRSRSPSQLRSPSRRWPPIAAGVVALLGGVYGGYGFMHWQPNRHTHNR